MAEPRFVQRNRFTKPVTQIVTVNFCFCNIQFTILDKAIAVVIISTGLGIIAIDGSGSDPFKPFRRYGVTKRCLANEYLHSAAEDAHSVMEDPYSITAVLPSVPKNRHSVTKEAHTVTEAIHSVIANAFSVTESIHRTAG